MKGDSKEDEVGLHRGCSVNSRYRGLNIYNRGGTKLKEDQANDHTHQQGLPNLTKDESFVTNGIFK